MKSNNERGARASQSRSRADASPTGRIVAETPYHRVASFLSSRTARPVLISLEMTEQRVRQNVAASMGLVSEDYSSLERRVIALTADTRLKR